MRIYEELICVDIGRKVLDILELGREEYIDTANTKAIEILEDIKSVLHSDMTDFEMIEEIVCIFEKKNIDCGGCHDFG